MIVDLMPCHSPEWALATWKVGRARVDDVIMAYIGAFKAKLDLEQATRTVKGMLMSDWWDSCPEGGPKTRASEIDGLHICPELQLCVWREFRPHLTTSAISKFESSDQQALW